MKKLVLSLALLMAASVCMAQSAEDKAKAKAEAAALKAAQKEARAQFNEARNMMDALNMKLADKEKPLSAEEVMEESKKGQQTIAAAIASGHLQTDKLGEAYKVSSFFANNINNLLIASAGNKEPFDTLAFLPNLIQLTDALAGELQYTKVVKGESGNEKELNSKKFALANSKTFYIYAAQFESECQRYTTALDGYDRALNYVKNYPVVADEVKCQIEDNQIAYYAYYTAHDAKMYDQMDKYYDLAITFEKGAEGVKQLATYKYLEQGDTLKWANVLKEQCLKDPANNEVDIQRLLAYFQSRSVDEMSQFADEVLAVAPTSKIANYGKGYALFNAKKYEEALVCYTTCTEHHPDYYDAWYQAGLCKYRQAIDLNITIDGIKNQVKAKEVKETVKKLFGAAIPYFEKARECTPDEPQKWAFELKQCYSAVGDKAKADEMDKLM